MAPRATLVEQWSSLSVGELATRVRRVVKDHDDAAQETWALVRADQVLSAKVRGALSRLAADVRGTRDEAMWMLWISQARTALSQKAEEPVAQRRPARAEKPKQDNESERTAAALLDAALAATSRPAPAASPAPQVLFHAPGA